MSIDNSTPRNRARCEIPRELAAWLEKNMERAPRFEAVCIRCGPRLPLDWIPGNARYIGLTLWNTIYLREPFEFCSAENLELLIHELVHVAQFQSARIRFPLSYLWWLGVRGYRRHPAEIEARRIASETFAKLKQASLFQQLLQA